MSDAGAIDLLREMVRIPSVSGCEAAVCALISRWLEGRGIQHSVLNGNIAAWAAAPDPSKRTLALVAHLDTVAHSEGWTRNPYDPGDDPDVIFGLGSNDDGGGVAAMLLTLCHFHDGNLPFNLLLLLVREEECSGPDGVRWLFGPEGPFSKTPGETGWLPVPDWAIVGEPTGMKAATSERGLLVIDGEAVGVSGHAARGEGVNALYIALDDISRLRSHTFSRVSPEMGAVRLAVTQIEAGTSHNVIPGRCRFVVDVRPCDLYTPLEILEELQAICKSTLHPRNLLHKASATATDSPLRKTAAALGIPTFSSPTSSDWMLLPCDALKMGPGESSRSHHADEFILAAEIEAAVSQYISFIERLHGYIME